MYDCEWWSFKLKGINGDFQVQIFCVSVESHLQLDHGVKNKLAFVVLCRDELRKEEFS